MYESRQTHENQTVPEPKFAPVLNKDDEVLELGDAFDLEGFQVVRREFFAHINEPSLTFNNSKIYVNTACLSKFPTVDYVQVMINQNTKILALRPCAESSRDAFRWCTVSKGKRKPKQTTGRLFCAMLFSLLNWNPDYRYKLLGKVIYANGEYMVAFDLTATEVYQRVFAEGQKPKAARTPVFPAEWKTQFGLPLRQHEQSLQINIFEGYAVFGIKDNSKEGQTQKVLSAKDAQQILPQLENSEGGIMNGD